MAIEKAGSESFTELAAESAENKSAEDLLRWTFETYGSRAAIVTSFQVDGMAILDMASKVTPYVRVITVDTCRMPQDTYDLIDEVRDRYGVDVEVFYPDQVELESMVTRHGANAFYGSVSLRLLCCEVRKVNPLNNRALESVDAWVTGLRRSQGTTRSDVRKVEVDSSHGGIIKVNPLADWTESQVWDYVRNNNVPSNKLYEKGYTSIGCAPCTRPTNAGEDERSGRWWEKGVPKECGIHLKMPRQSVR